MKISKKRLKEIIKEELDALSEAPDIPACLPENQVVSRDGKKKGCKISGTWKSGKIKVWWKGMKHGTSVEVSVGGTDPGSAVRKKW